MKFWIWTMMLLALRAQAQDRIYNGGEVLRCSKPGAADTVEMVESYYLKSVGRKLDSKLANLTLEGKIQHLFAKIQKVQPQRSQKLMAFANEFTRTMSKLKNFRLDPIAGSGLLPGTPIGCVRYPVVTQANQKAVGLGQTRYFTDEDTLNLLQSDDLAILAAHESFHREKLESSPTSDLLPVQRLTAELAAEDFDLGQFLAVTLNFYDEVELGFLTHKKPRNLDLPFPALGVKRNEDQWIVSNTWIPLPFSRRLTVITWNADFTKIIQASGGINSFRSDHPPLEIDGLRFEFNPDLLIGIEKTSSNTSNFIRAGNATRGETGTMVEITHVPSGRKLTVANCDFNRFLSFGKGKLKIHGSCSLVWSEAGRSPHRIVNRFVDEWTSPGTTIPTDLSGAIADLRQLFVISDPLEGDTIYMGFTPIRLPLEGRNGLVLCNLTWDQYIDRACRLTRNCEPGGDLSFMNGQVRVEPRLMRNLHQPIAERCLRETNIDAVLREPQGYSRAQAHGAPNWMLSGPLLQDLNLTVKGFSGDKVQLIPKNSPVELETWVNLTTGAVELTALRDLKNQQKFVPENGKWRRQKDYRTIDPNHTWVGSEK